MRVNLLTEEEKDNLLAQRQQTIQALLNYIITVLKDREETDLVVILKQFSKYVSEGGEVKTAAVATDQMQRARELMDFFRVDYFALTAEGEEGTDYCMYLTREDQSESVDKVMEALEFEKNTHLVWVAIEDFLRLNIGNVLCRVTISREQVSALSQVVNDTGLMFSVNFLADDRADVYFHDYDREQMRECFRQLFEKLGIERNINISRVGIDSAYTAQRIAEDKERNENSQSQHKRHHAFASLSL